MLTLAILEAIVAADTGTPRFTTNLNERLGSRRTVECDIARAPIADDDATVTIYGADLPHRLSADAHAEFTGDGTETEYQTEIPYEAFSNHNWLVRVSGELLTRAAVPADASEYSVTDVDGKAKITVGAAQDSGAPIIIDHVSVETLQAATDAGQAFARSDIVCRDVVWAVVAGTEVGPTNIYLHGQP